MPETTHIPTGEYPKPAPAHQIDLETHADELLATLPGSRRQSKSLAREAGVSIIMMAQEGGDVVKEHAAPGVVTVYALRGIVNLRTADKTIELRSGQMAVFQPGVHHDLEAQEQSVVVLTLTGGDE